MRSEWGRDRILRGGSMLAVPLSDADRPVGVLSLECSITNFFTDHHVSATQLLGSLLVFARRHADDLRATEAARALGEAMRQIRESMGLTREQLAAQLGITRSAFSRQEAGTQAPSRSQLYRWCQALDLVATTSAARVEMVDISEAMKHLVKEDPSRLQRLTPSQFERFVAERLDRMGYDVTLTGRTRARDGGIDLIAVPKIRNVAAFLLAGQVKHHRTGARTGRSAVDRLLAWKDSPFRMGLLVTNTEFTRDARWLAEREPNTAFLRLRDFEDLKRWIQSDFTSEHDWREIPSRIELAPGVTIDIPRPTIAQPKLIWPHAGEVRDLW
jgi:transcriptional regulator with XRE-family HTH domain